MGCFILICFKTVYKWNILYIHCFFYSTVFTNIDAHGSSLILIAVYYSVTVYSFSSCCTSRLLPPPPAYKPCCSLCSCFLVSMWERVSPGYIPEVELLNNGVVFSSGILDNARLLSKVAVPNYTWNNIVWVSHLFLINICVLPVWWGHIHFSEYYWSWAYFHVHWLFMVPCLWFTHCHGNFHSTLLLVLSWRVFF